jgi:hypothetical protein
MNGGIKISLVAALLAGCATTPNGVQVRAIADPVSKLRPGADRLADAKGQLAIGNVGLALEAFRTAARLYPDNAEAYVGMAACYEQMGRFDLAESKYQAALAIEPRDPELLGRLAVALDRQGKSDDAMGVRGEIAALRSASVALDKAQAEPVLAAASLAPAQTVSVALPKAPQPAQTVSVAFPKVKVAAPAPIDAPAPAPAAPPSQAQFVIAEPVGRLTAAQLANESKLNIAAAGTMPSLNAAPMRAATPMIAAPAQVRPAAAPTNLLAFADPVSKLLPAKLASEGRPMLSAETAASLTATPLRASAPFIVQPMVRTNAPAPAAAPAMYQPERATVAPRLERVSLGEVALLTGSGPVWRAPAVAAPQKLAARWVPLNMASARPNIRIFNAARQQGLAARNRDYLVNRGWRKIAIADAGEVRERSLVLYPASRPALGKSLAAQFGIRAQASTTTDVFVVYLGRDVAGMKVAALKG